MYAHIFQEIGLPKNEALIYETLLREGESSASEISTKSKIHRRNVYDSLGRLLDRGLIFEIQERRENRYQAVDPQKLSELVAEKQAKLSNIMPELTALHQSQPKEQAVYIYRGIEGWKNCMRDILRLGEDYYCIAGKGAWMDPRLATFFPWFIEELGKQKISCYVLFEQVVKAQQHPVTNHVGPHYRFIPERFSAPASVEIFGDRVNLVSDIHFGGVGDDFVFTVVEDSNLAQAFRTWFQMMWEICPEHS